MKLRGHISIENDQRSVIDIIEIAIIKRIREILRENSEKIKIKNIVATGQKNSVNKDSLLQNLEIKISISVV